MIFLQAAVFKIPGTEALDMNVAYTAGKLALATVAVLLAFVLEVVTSVAPPIGWRTRIAAAALIPYMIVLTLLFHTTFETQVDYGFFVDHLIMIAGLLYVAACGAERFALHRDTPARA